MAEEQKVRETQLKEKLANEEYKIWKKQSPFIYDVCLTKALQFPSPTIEWFPDEHPFTKQDVENSSFKTYSLLLGTQSFGAASDYVYKGLLDLPQSHYDGKEPLINLISEGQKIIHKGDVNRARYSRLAPNLIATMADNGDSYVFDTNTYSTDSADGKFEPTLVLKHHKKQGYGLSWNSKAAGVLATGTADGTVAIWDISSQLGGSSRGAHVQPTRVYSDHAPAIVNDVAWSPHKDFLLATGNEDNTVGLYDTRIATPASSLTDLHSAGVNSVNFHPTTEHLLLTGSADTTVKVIDLRYKKSVFTLNGHDKDVTFVKWSPHDPSVLASGGDDRRIRVWDLSLVGTPQTSEEEQEGPPELVFIHGGHVNRICEFDWHPTLPWTIASISEDDIAQVWRVAGSIVDPPVEEEAEEGDEDEAVVDGTAANTEA